MSDRIKKLGRELADQHMKGYAVGRREALADAKARIEDLHYGDDNLLIGTGYQLAVNDALAALTQPQTESALDRAVEQAPEQIARKMEAGRQAMDGGGAATPRGVADARSHTPGNDLSFTEIQRNELAMARDKFPGNAHMMVALTEEVGEVARALLEQGPGSREVLEECAQVAAVAQRIATEGDGDFTATGQQEAVADSQPGPYAKAFRERVCPVPEFPSIRETAHEAIIEGGCCIQCGLPNNSETVLFHSCQAGAPADPTCPNTGHKFSHCDCDLGIEKEES